jgi:hypothetical protein
LKFHEEDSKYEGKPLIEPKIPYFYDHKVRRVDKSLPVWKKLGTKVVYVS